MQTVGIQKNLLTTVIRNDTVELTPSRNNRRNNRADLTNTSDIGSGFVARLAESPNTPPVLTTKTLIHDNLFHNIRTRQVTANSSPVPPLLFKVTGTIQACGIELFSTSEGLYLAKEKVSNPFLISKQKIADIKTHFDLTLAESDSRFEEMHQLHDQMLTLMCYTTTSVLRVFSHIHDRYITITDARNNDLVLYSSHGSIYQPVCVDIDAIDVLDKTTYCYQDTPVQFVFRNVTINAFLNSQGILKPTSQFQNCNMTFQRILLPSKRVIIRNSTMTRLLDKLSISSTLLDVVNSDNSEPNFNHHQNIIQDINVIKQIEQALNVQEVSGMFLVLPDRDDSTDPLKKALGEAAKSIKSIGTSIWSYVIYGIIAIIGIGILFLIAISIRCFASLVQCCNSCCCWCKRFTNPITPPIITFKPTTEDIQFLQNYRAHRALMPVEA